MRDKVVRWMLVLMAALFLTSGKPAHAEWDLLLQEWLPETDYTNVAWGSPLLTRTLSEYDPMDPPGAAAGEIYAMAMCQAVSPYDSSAQEEGEIWGDFHVVFEWTGMASPGAFWLNAGLTWASNSYALYEGDPYISGFSSAGSWAAYYDPYSSPPHELISTSAWAANSVNGIEVDDDDDIDYTPLTNLGDNSMDEDLLECTISRLGAAASGCVDVFDSWLISTAAAGQTESDSSVSVSVSPENGM